MKKFSRYILMSSTKYFFFSLSVCMLLFTCTFTEDVNTSLSALPLTEVRKIVLDPGFVAGQSTFKTFKEHEYICFYDYNTEKKIWLYDLASETTHNIDLSMVNRLGFQISGFELLGLDTILVLTKYTNKLLFLNRQGTIWKYLDLGQFTKGNFYFEANANTSPFMQNDTTALIPISPQVDPNISEHVDYLEFSLKKRTSPHLLEISNIYEDPITYRLGGENTYYEFTNPGDIIAESPNFRYLNGDLFFFSNFSNKIYTLNRNSLETEGAKAIESLFGKIKVEAPNQEKLRINPNFFTEAFLKNPTIHDLDFLPVKKEYWITIRGGKKDQKATPWSIIVADSSFQKAQEFRMDPEIYYHNIHVWSGGVLIEHRTGSNDSSHSTKRTLTHFRYE